MPRKHLPTNDSTTSGKTKVSSKLRRGRQAAPNRRKEAAVKATRSAAAKQTGPQRLQRLLASAGYGSRRQCEELIEAGRVDVDGEVVSKLGTVVDPKDQRIRVDGVILKKQKLVYYAVNKPEGVLSTNRDPQGRPRVVDLVPKSERVYPVGRLDLSSNGLMLLTNDGDLAQQLTHPKFGVRKVYRVTVAGKVDGETMRAMRRGMYIAEGFVKVEGAKILKSRSRATELEIVLKEGKNREIRRILARLGHKVQRLTRIAIGPLRLGDMPAGAHRVLSRAEIQKLHLAVENSRAEAEAEAEGRPRSPRGKSARKGVRSGGSPSGRQSKGKKKKTKSRSGGRNSDTSFEGPLPIESFRVGSIIGGDTETGEPSTRSNKEKRGGSKRKQPKTNSRHSTQKRGGKPKPKAKRSTGSNSRGKKKPGRKRGR